MKKILIIEDEPDTIKVIKKRLSDKEFEVIVAEDGSRGLQLARRENPDLIILDLMLPKIDGYKICRMLKFDDKYKKTPIILFTARGDEKDKTLGEEVGADAYIMKPFESSELISKINELLGKG